MATFRRRRGHPYSPAEDFNNAANYFTDDALQEAYYFDDALTLRYVTGD